MRQFILHELQNSMIKHTFRASLPPNMSWNDFCDKYYASYLGVDPFNILLHVSARLLERDIHIITHNNVKDISGGSKASSKPRIWIYCDNNNLYTPLYQFGPTQSFSLTSNMLVKYDLKFMDKEEIFDSLKTHVNSPKKSTKLQLKVTGYMSKVIGTKDRENSIWVKESMALIGGLAKFKPLLEISPAVLAIVDSQVVYFLSHKNLRETSLKAKRLGTLLHLEYPNLMIMAVKGTANV